MKLSSSNKGLTLIETVISVMIMAVAAVGIASVMISTSMSYKKAELKQTSLYMIKTASEKLRDYVTADLATLPTDLSQGLGGYDGLCGENNPGQWPLQVDTRYNLDCYFDMPVGSGITLRDKFPGGTAQEFYYEVTDTMCCPSCPANMPCKKVIFTINYVTE